MIYTRLGFLLAMGISAKLLIGTNIQIFNPFLTVIAAGISTNAVVVGRLVALRNLTVMVAPLLGSLPDRFRAYRDVPDIRFAPR